MITRVTPDKNKATALKNMAIITIERLSATNKLKYPGNTLEDYYDAIHKLMEALTAIEGVKAKGDGAHQELIDYISTKYGFDESTRMFLQKMREYRNRISYEGFTINQNYLTQNEEKIKGVIERLTQLLNYTKP